MITKNERNVNFTQLGRIFKHDKSYIYIYFFHFKAKAHCFTHHLNVIFVSKHLKWQHICFFFKYIISL